MIRNIFPGKINSEFLFALLRNHRFFIGSLWMSLFVTSKCAVNCKECIMGNLRRACPNYQMSLDEIGKFIEISERSHYYFDLILTGGEPLSWDYLKDGIKLLRSSKVCSSLHLFTNAMDISKLNAEIASHVDRIRISRYEGNYENAIKLSKLFGKKVEIVDRRKFWENPTHKVPDALPARCCNQEIMLFDYKIYACPHSASIDLTGHSDIKLYNPLEYRFLKGLERIKKTQQNVICSLCISNLNVRNNAVEVPSR